LTATENDIIAYRKYLVETGYKPTTIALKLAVVRRLYEAIRWRGLGNDNPAAGVKAPKGRTARDERVKYFPPNGLRQLLAASQGDGPFCPVLFAYEDTTDYKLTVILTGS
jgi:site-specific recombinase XerD